MISIVNESRTRHGRDGDPFEVHAISLDAYSVEGIERLESLGVTDVVVGFRDAYKPEPDTESLDEKLAALRSYSDEVIARCKHR